MKQSDRLWYKALFQTLPATPLIGFAGVFAMVGYNVLTNVPGAPTEAIITGILFTLGVCVGCALPAAFIIRKGFRTLKTIDYSK